MGARTLRPNRRRHRGRQRGTLTEKPLENDAPDVEAAVLVP